MAWNQTANIQGPVGPAGPAGTPAVSQITSGLETIPVAGASGTFTLATDPVWAWVGGPGYVLSMNGTRLGTYQVVGLSHNLPYSVTYANFQPA